MSLSVAHRKAAQALNYFARQEGGSINKLKALKLLFFADRYHLRKHGRPVSECAYFAMTHGPVASEAKSVAEECDTLPTAARAYGRKFIRRDGDYDFSAAPLWTAPCFRRVTGKLRNSPGAISAASASSNCATSPTITPSGSAMPPN